MAVTQVTVKELLMMTEGAKSIKIQALRTSVDYATRKLIALQRDLRNLKSAHLLALQNINRNQKRESLEGVMDPDRFQTTKPDQSIKHYDVMTPDPDPRINWNRRKLEEDTGRSTSQLVRLDDEIKKVSSLINQFETIKQKNIAELAEIEDVNVVIARDNIAKAQYTTVYMLYEICKRYKELSTNADGSRKFSESAPIVRQYQILIQAFGAYMARDPDVTKGNLVLKKEDPGCLENENALKAILDKRQAVLADNTALPSTTTKISEKMEADINNGKISENVSRQNVMKRLAEAGNSLNEITSNIGKMVDTATNSVNNVLTGLSPTGQPVKIFGTTLNSLLDASFFADAVTNSYKKMIGKLYDGMPLCNNPAESADSSAVRADQVGMDVAEGLAGKLVATKFASTARNVSSADALSSLDAALAEVNRAAARPKTTPTTNAKTLDVETKTYTSTNYHDSVVLENGRQMYDRAQQFFNGGNIVISDYDKYVEKLQAAITNGTSCTVADRKH